MIVKIKEAKDPKFINTKDMKIGQIGVSSYFNVVILKTNTNFFDLREYTTWNELDIVVELIPPNTTIKIITDK